jgi:hypothetical protein
MANFDFYKDVKFVTDEPADRDEFQSGAHERVANTLVKVITSSEGGRAIGLEGTWGSGKSTVIDLARSKLEAWNETNSPKHVVFLFDAWAHQGDPLRRVFLDSLIGELVGKSIDKGKWTKKLEELRSLKKKIIENKAEKLSWVARISLIVLPLFPLAYLLFSEFLKTRDATISLPLIGAISKEWVGFWAVAILAAPYVMALLTWLARLSAPTKGLWILFPGD